MASDYDRAHHEDVNPNDVQWNESYKLNEKAVKEYEDNPNKQSTDGDPFVTRRNGKLYGNNGRHRGEAARRKGRKLRTRVHDEDAVKPDVKQPVEQHSPTQIHVPAWKTIVIGGSGGVRVKGYYRD